MAFPIMLRMAAYGTPAALAAWRSHVDDGRSRFGADLRTPIKLAQVRVDTFSGARPALRHELPALAVHGVDLVAQWQDQDRNRHWVHVHDDQVSDLDVPGDAAVGFLLAHRGKFRHVDPNSRTWPVASHAMAADASPLGGLRRRFITFDLEHLWTPGTDAAPDGTAWSGDALDVTELALGSFLAERVMANQFAWQQWTVDALNCALDHRQARTCDVPHLVAATAGLPVAELTPLLSERTEPASRAISVVRTLAEEELTVEQIADVLPALLAA